MPLNNSRPQIIRYLKLDPKKSHVWPIQDTIHMIINPRDLTLKQNTKK